MWKSSQQKVFVLCWETEDIPWMSAISTGKFKCIRIEKETIFKPELKFCQRIQLFGNTTGCCADYTRLEDRPHLLPRIRMRNITFILIWYKDKHSPTGWVRSMLIINTSILLVRSYGVLRRLSTPWRTVTPPPASPSWRLSQRNIYLQTQLDIIFGSSVFNATFSV